MRVLERVPLRKYTYYKIGGQARFLVEVRSRNEVFKAVELIRKLRVGRVLFLGLGANLLIADKPFDGLVVKLKKGEGRVGTRWRKDGEVEVFAGETLERLTQESFKRGLVGLEWSGGLPSSIGAAVRGNVGAFGGEIKDVLEWVEILDISRFPLRTKRIEAKQLSLSYRHSLIKKKRSWLVVEACFRLIRSGEKELEEAKKKYRECFEYRESRHPLGYPSCGSVFKNITGAKKIGRVLARWPEVKSLVESKWGGKIPMGYVIERLGLAGKLLGGAQISPKHCNFIVNRGKASFDDVMGLIELVREKVEKSFGFVPELEVEVIE